MKMKMKRLFIWLILVRYVRSYIILLNSTDTHLDRLSAFGPVLTHDGIVGNLQVARYNGCQVIEPPCENWIALVERGNCSFINKVRFMQQSHAKAVIVGDRHSNNWVTMYTSGDSSDITIPSVYVPQSQLLSLLNHIHKNNDMSIPIKLTSQTLFARPILEIIITTIIPPTVLVFIIYFIWKLRQQPRRRQKKENFSTNISHLPLKTFCEKREEEADECVICLEEYKQGDVLRILPCQHNFHSLCIDTWLLTRKRYCPICKRDVFQPDENTPLLD